MEGIGWEIQPAGWLHLAILGLRSRLSRSLCNACLSTSKQLSSVSNSPIGIVPCPKAMT
jgi:hypothetical protein